MLDRETFARWSFERDVDAGCYHGEDISWETLDETTRQVYMEEAEFYVSGKSEIGLPLDIIERAEKEGIEI